MALEVEVLPDAAAVARRGAALVSECAAAAIGERGRFTFAVSASISRCRFPASAFAMMFSPSAYAAMSPYSMPLCTIFTKWPAPDGPQWR